MCLVSYSMLALSSFFLSFVLFFFKQKTAYEMRISDWSSDVCSSDLYSHACRAAAALRLPPQPASRSRSSSSSSSHKPQATSHSHHAHPSRPPRTHRSPAAAAGGRCARARGRSEERRVGKACVRTCESRWRLVRTTKQTRKNKND